MYNYFVRVYSIEVCTVNNNNNNNNNGTLQQRLDNDSSVHSLAMNLLFKRLIWQLVEIAVKPAIK